MTAKIGGNEKVPIIFVLMLPPSPLKTLTHEVGLVVLQAAAYIRSEFGTVGIGLSELKDHNSLVSRVDQQAERILVEGLKALLPQSSFLTEEETVVQGTSELRWIIDPLDGTTNFLFGLPLFAISVALEQEGEIVLGIVYDVMAMEMYSAWTSGGAWCNGRAISVSQTSELDKSLLATGFPYYDYDHMDAYLKLLASFMEKTRGIRRLGSAALDLAWTACGRFDAFYEYGLHAWDVAGGILLVREAGGQVSDFQGGKDCLYGKTLIAGNKFIQPMVQNEISLYFSPV